MRIGYMGRREACERVAGTGSRDNKKGPGFPGPFDIQWRDMRGSNPRPPT